MRLLSYKLMGSATLAGVFVLASAGAAGASDGHRYRQSEHSGSQNYARESWKQHDDSQKHDYKNSESHKSDWNRSEDKPSLEHKPATYQAPVKPVHVEVPVVKYEKSEPRHEVKYEPKHEVKYEPKHEVKYEPKHEYKHEADREYSKPVEYAKPVVKHENKWDDSKHYEHKSYDREDRKHGVVYSHNTVVYHPVHQHSSNCEHYVKPVHHVYHKPATHTYKPVAHVTVYVPVVQVHYQPVAHVVHHQPKHHNAYHKVHYAKADYEHKGHYSKKNDCDKVHKAHHYSAKPAHHYAKHTGHKVARDCHRSGNHHYNA